MPKSPKCFLKKKGVDVVSYDIDEGKGYCVCLLPKEALPEEIGLCWFNEDKLESSELFSAMEAAKVGGALVYAATLIVGEKGRG